MRVAITGNRRLTVGDVGTVYAKVGLLVADPAVAEIVFGGAVGADTEALRAALVARRGQRPRLTVVVPGRLADQPAETQPVSAQADEVVELALPRTRDGNGVYRRRNEAMVARADMVVAFWNGAERGGTWMTMGIARRHGRPVEVVRIRGGD